MAELKNIPLDKVNSVRINGKNYTVIDRKVIEENNGIGLTTRELFLYLYKEIQKDPYKKERFDNLSNKEKVNYLAKEVMKLKKTYNLEFGIDQAKPKDRAEAVTKKIADSKIEDARSNQELGIVESNGVINTIEEKPNGEINVNEVTNSNSDTINVVSSSESDSAEVAENETMTNEEVNLNSSTTTVTSDTYLSNDNSEIVNETNTDTQAMETNNNVQEQVQEASVSYTPHSTRFVRTLRPRTLQPNQRYRVSRPNGFIENSIMITILVLATIFGLIIGSIIALYK